MCLLCLFVACIMISGIGSTILKLVSVLVLVAANGFFVAAEFALVGVRVSRIETLVAGGSSAAKRLMGLLKNLNSYLSACQLGITLASLALGWIGEPAIARLLEGPLSGLSDAWRHGIAFVLEPPRHGGFDYGLAKRRNFDRRHDRMRDWGATSVNIHSPLCEH